MMLQLLFLHSCIGYGHWRFRISIALLGLCPAWSLKSIADFYDQDHLCLSLVESRNLWKQNEILFLSSISAPPPPPSFFWANHPHPHPQVLFCNYAAMLLSCLLLNSRLHSSKRANSSAPCYAIVSASWIHHFSHRGTPIAVTFEMNFLWIEKLENWMVTSH